MDVSRVDNVLFYAEKRKSVIFKKNKKFGIRSRNMVKLT